MQEANVCIVSSVDGDWEGIYVNDLLQDEGHTLKLPDIFSQYLMNKTIISFTQIEAGEWLRDDGSLPITLEQVHQFNESR